MYSAVCFTETAIVTAVGFRGGWTIVVGKSREVRVTEHNSQPDCIKCILFLDDFRAKEVI